MIGKTVLECTFNWHPEACSKTESMWSLLQKFSYWNRATTGDIRKFLFSLRSAEKIDLLRSKVGWFETFQEGIGLSKNDFDSAFPESFSIFPRSEDIAQKVRGCETCLEQGFHSSLYQMKWLEFCPMHDNPLNKLRVPSKYYFRYVISARLLNNPFGIADRQNQTENGAWQTLQDAECLEGYSEWQDQIKRRYDEVPLPIRPIEFDEADPYFIAYRLSTLYSLPDRPLVRAFAKARREYHVSTILSPRKTRLRGSHLRIPGLVEQVSREIVNALSRTDHKICLQFLKHPPSGKIAINSYACPYLNAFQPWRQYWANRTYINELVDICQSLGDRLGIKDKALRNHFVAVSERLIIWQHYALIAEWMRLFKEEFLFKNNQNYFFPTPNGPLFWFDRKYKRLHWWFWEEIHWSQCEQQIQRELDKPHRRWRSPIFNNYFSTDELFSRRDAWWPSGPRELNELSEILALIYRCYGIDYPTPND